MTISNFERMHPGSPDPVITKQTHGQKYDQAALARLAHVNDLIDQINDQIIPAINTLTAEGFQGFINASGFVVNYPVAFKDQYWIISNAGYIGSKVVAPAEEGTRVEVGDMVVCIIDNPVAGPESVCGANFRIMERNLKTLTQVLDPTEKSIDVTALLHTGGNLINYNVTVDDVQTFWQYGVLQAASALTGGNTIEGVVTTLAGYAGDAALTALVGTRHTLMAISTSAADKIGYKASFVNDRDVAATIDVGFWADYSAAEMSAASNAYGYKVTTIDGGTQFIHSAGEFDGYYAHIGHKATGGSIYGSRFIFDGEIDSAATNVYGNFIDMSGITLTNSNEVHGIRVITKAGVDSAFWAYDTTSTHEVHFIYNGSHAIRATGPTLLNGLVTVSNEAGTGTGIVTSLPGQSLELYGGNNAGGAGGEVHIYGGTPGATFQGGSIDIMAGDGGGTSGDGGAIGITGGSSTDGDGGIIQITAGNGSGVHSAGNVEITAGSTAGSGHAGNLYFYAGDSTTGLGGDVSIEAGNSGLALKGGDFGISAGNGGPTGIGGELNLYAGRGGATSGAGGTANLYGGNANNGNSAGGALNLGGGVGVGNGAGGDVTIDAGDGGVTGNGGNVILSPGTTGGTGTDGDIVDLGYHRTDDNVPDSKAYPYFNLKTVKFVIGWSGHATADYVLPSAANMTPFNIQLGGGNIIPAKSQVLHAVLVCTVGSVFSGGATTLVAGIGNATGGAQFAVSGSIYALNAVKEIASGSAIAVATSVTASSVWISDITPGANWDTQTAGEYEVYVTYIDNSTVR